MKLEGGERLVFKTLLELHGDSKDYVEDSRLADATKMAVQDVRDWLETLEGKGFVERTRLSNGFSAYVTAMGKQALRLTEPISSPKPAGHNASVTPDPPGGTGAPVPQPAPGLPPKTWSSLNGNRGRETGTQLESITSCVPVYSPYGPPPEGGLPLDDPSYIERSTDLAFLKAVSRGDSIVLLRGARQVGKTSLLARGLQGARSSGARTVFTDFQGFDRSELGSLDAFYQTLAGRIAQGLGIDDRLEDLWNPKLPPNKRFEGFLEHKALATVPGALSGRWTRPTGSSPSTSRPSSSVCSDRGTTPVRPSPLGRGRGSHW